MAKCDVKFASSARGRTSWKKGENASVDRDQEFESDERFGSKRTSREKFVARRSKTQEKRFAPSSINSGSDGSEMFQTDFTRNCKE